jgi:hypothetical protein
MHKNRNPSSQIHRVMDTIHPTRGMFFGALIFGALLAFELFNYSTTDFALADLLGDLRFFDIHWSTILALAFCGIDFAGVARLFVPMCESNKAGEAGVARLFVPMRESNKAGEAGSACLFTPARRAPQSSEVWYLFAAWLLAATMNAMLTWWGVAVAILSHTSLGTAIIPTETMLEVVPIFIAILVWVIRILIIGSFSVAGNRMLSQAELAYHVPAANKLQPARPGLIPNQVASFYGTPTPDSKPTGQGSNPAEPTYHPASMSSSNKNAREIRK